MNRKSFELKFCFLFVSVAFAFFLGLPLANLAYKSLQTGSGTGLGNYAAILTDDAFLTAFRNSFAISALEAAITTAAAFILAYGLHLTRIPGKIKEGLQLVVMMPMFLPSITYGFAVIYSFGKQGLITKLVGEQLFPIYGFWGLLISFIVYTLPPAFLVLYNAFFLYRQELYYGIENYGRQPAAHFVDDECAPAFGQPDGGVHFIVFPQFYGFWYSGIHRRRIQYDCR